MTAASSPSLEQTKQYLPWVVAVSLFMLQLDATILNTAVPTMAASLNVASLSLKSVLTSYTITLAVLIPMSGWIADRFGTRRVFMFAVALFTLGSLLCGLSMNVPMLVASRIIQGMGAAFMMPVGRISILRTFPKSEMLKAMNFVIIPALLGPLLGPFMGGLIVHWMPWRMIFFLNLPFGVLGLYLAHLFMPNHTSATAGKFDGPGFVLFGGGVALLSYVLEVFGEHSLGYPAIGALLALSFLMLAGYGWHANRDDNPILPLNLFNIRTFRVSVIGSCITRLGISGMPFLLPLLYQVGLGYEAWQAGLLTMPQAFAAMGMKMLTRPILGRFGYKNVLLVNTTLIGLMIMVFAFVGRGTPVWVILVISLAQGFFSALQFTSMNSLAYADTSDEQASDASTIASTAQQLSISFGIACASLVAGAFLNWSEHPSSVEMITALHHSFIVLGILTIASAVGFLFLKPDDGDSVSNRKTNAADRRMAVGEGEGAA